MLLFNLKGAPPARAERMTASPTVASRGGWFIIMLLAVSTGAKGGMFTAVEDSARTEPGVPVVIPVLANDLDDAAKQLSVLRATAPSRGQVRINAGNAGAPAIVKLAELYRFAAVQLSNSVTQIGETNRFPRSTILTNGLWRTRSAGDWASGFFPGCLWLLYEASGDASFRAWAENWMGGLAAQQTNPNTDDLGFMFNCSFGNGYRLTTNADFRPVLLQAARSVSNRFNAVVGGFGYWSGTTNAQYDTWMDSLMNMELLFRAAQLSSDTNYFVMAYSHAVKAMSNHVRADGSTYHIVHYDGTSGEVLGRGTFAGAADESTWARGHAWATYGFTMAYRETRDARFLETAQRVANYYLAHAPADGVPYWDYQYWDYSPTNAARDSSAAAITMAGLLELSQLETNAVASSNYWWAAQRIFRSLISSNYLAQGSMSSGILLHGVGETPPLWDQEIDVSLIYGDYYFLEGLKRLKEAYGHATVTYAPERGFVGTDSFMYQAGDSAGDSATANVTVQVAPALRITLDGSGARVLSFMSVTNRLYEVQYEEEFVGVGNWRVLAGPVPGTGGEATFVDTAAGSARFYRLKVR